MRRSNEIKIGTAIRDYFKALGLEQGLKEARILNSWGDVVGKSIAQKTQKMNLYKRVLFVYIESSIVKNELMMIRKDIINALNERAGEKLIDEIVFR